MGIYIQAILGSTSNVAREIIVTIIVIIIFITPIQLVLVILECTWRVATEPAGWTTLTTLRRLVSLVSKTSAIGQVQALLCANVGIRRNLRIQGSPVLRFS